jgi:hypothetical protein
MAVGVKAKTKKLNAKYHLTTTRAYTYIVILMSVYASAGATQIKLFNEKVLFLLYLTQHEVSV